MTRPPVVGVDRCIRLDRVGDIGSLHSSFVRQISWVDDIDYVDPLASVILDNILCMRLGVWCTRLGREKYGDILPIEILSREEREDILLDHVIWFGIYRDDDDMLELGSSLHDDRITREITLLQ